MGRIGKIARLPAEARYELNRGIQEGESAKTILKRLNQDEGVKLTMDVHYGGAAVTEQNLSEWRKDGYQRWLRNEEICHMVRQLLEEFEDVDCASDSKDISQVVATRMAVEFTRVAQELLAQSGDPQERWTKLQQILPQLAQLRRLDQRAGILAMKRQEWQWKCDDRTRRKEFAEFIESENLTRAVQREKKRLAAQKGTDEAENPDISS